MAGKQLMRRKYHVSSILNTCLVCIYLLDSIVRHLKGPFPFEEIIFKPIPTLDLLPNRFLSSPSDQLSPLVIASAPTPNNSTVNNLFAKFCSSLLLVCKGNTLSLLHFAPTKIRPQRHLSCLVIESTYLS